MLPPAVTARVSVEAGIALGWRAYVGDHGESVSLEHFGASADYAKLYAEFGITPEAVAQAARRAWTAQVRHGRLTGSAPQQAARQTDGAADSRKGTAMTSQANDIVGQLTAGGVSVWLDDISRERLSTGNLASLISDITSGG